MLLGRDRAFTINHAMDRLGVVRLAALIEEAGGGELGADLLE